MVAAEDLHALEDAAVADGDFAHAEVGDGLEFGGDVGGHRSRRRREERNFLLLQPFPNPAGFQRIRVEPQDEDGIFAAPVIDPLPAAVIPAGKSLIVPVTVTVTNGRPLTFTFISSTNAIAIVAHTNNPFWKMNVVQVAAANAPPASIASPLTKKSNTKV